jgi:hypothetical protein
VCVKSKAVVVWPRRTRVQTFDFRHSAERLLRAAEKASHIPEDVYRCNLAAVSLLFAIFYLMTKHECLPISFLSMSR